MLCKWPKDIFAYKTNSHVSIQTLVNSRRDVQSWFNLNKRKTEIVFGWPDLLDGYDSAIGLLAFLQRNLVWVDSALKFDVKTSFFQLRLLSKVKVCLLPHDFERSHYNLLFVSTIVTLYMLALICPYFVACKLFKIQQLAFWLERHGVHTYTGLLTLASSPFQFYYLFLRVLMVWSHLT